MEALSAMGSLLKKLTELLADECARLQGVRREIRFLRSELNNMYALFEKLAVMENPDVQVKAWTKELRELAYDIEDCVDEFVHGVGTNGHNAPEGIKEFFRRSARRLKSLGTRRHIANQIRDLKARVMEVRDQRVSYKLDDLAGSSSTRNLAIDPRLCALFAEEADLVGIDGPRDELVRWLVQGQTEGPKRRKVLSIFGFGGLGKTTLANEVCRKIGKQFDCQAFVSVSQKPDVKRILWDIHSALTRSDGSSEQREIWDEKRLIEKIREVVQHKRYLIIIDDIWSKVAWEQLKCALPENHNGSRIITTTRIESVAKACCCLPGDRCYKIGALSEFDSRNLFFRRIFGSEDECPVQLEYVSTEILKKCGGLPLAIISIASLLASKSSKTKEQWEKVRASIGSALEKNPDLEGMKTILSLSYNDLPHYLKPCLLYLSIFPEDYYIERGSLVRRWIAEGFINVERGQAAEDVAESYFNELINRNMIQPVGFSYNGKAQGCRLHDIMLELIASKAVDENFVTILNRSTMSSKSGVVRRLSVQYDWEWKDRQQLALQEITSLSHVRSFSVFGNCDVPTPTLSFDDFRVLRVLSLDSESDEVVSLKRMCKLKQLKYLSLNAYKLPAEIGELKCLETLEWNNLYSSKNLLPQGVAQLQYLRHLLVNKNGILPEGIGRVHELQTLSHFNICESPVSAVQELVNLRNLRELSVSWDQAEPSDKRYKEYFSTSLSKLSSCSLLSVTLKSKNVIPVDFLASLSPPPCQLQRFWMWNSYFQRCPRWIAPLNNLGELKLDVWELEDQDLHILGELPALLHFQLWVVSLRKEKIVIKETGFRSLVAFRLWSGLPCLSFHERSMPKLETLELEFSACGAKSYGSTHTGIEHLLSLKTVSVVIYRDSAKTSNIVAAARQIREAVAKNPKNLKVSIVASNNERYSDFGEVMNDDELNEEEGSG